MKTLRRAKSIASSIKFHWQVQSLPDRRYLREIMLPAMSQSQAKCVLLAGTRRYTRRYPSLFAPLVTTVWTIDFDPDAAKFGNGRQHRTGDMRRVDQVFPEISFDIIHVNGLLGFGVDRASDIQTMIEACHRAMRPGGQLMLGWDADRTPDPLENPDVTSHFEHQGFEDLPARHRVVGVAGHDHVFDWFRAA